MTRDTTGISANSTVKMKERRHFEMTVLSFLTGKKNSRHHFQMTPLLFLNRRMTARFHFDGKRAGNRVAKVFPTTSRNYVLIEYECGCD